MYKIVVEQRVYRDLDKIPTPDLGKIYNAIESLESNPRQVGSKKLKGQGKTYRIRQGDYRIVYTIDEVAKVVSIILVRHRKEVCRDFF